MMIQISLSVFTLLVHSQHLEGTQNERVSNKKDMHPMNMDIFSHELEFDQSSWEFV